MRSFAVYTGVLLLAACQSKPASRVEPERGNTQGAASTRPDLGAADPHAASPHGGRELAPAPAAAPRLAWSAGGRFVKAESPSTMRLATYRVTRAPGDVDDGELSVFHFGSSGGDVEANIKRWVGQFADEKPAGGRRAERTVGTLRVHTVAVDEGRFASGMPGGPTGEKAAWALRGAIVETPDGRFFFKLVGPKRTVTAADADFEALLGSLRFAG